MTNIGFDGTEHSVLFFINKTEGELRVKFRVKVVYSCTNNLEEDEFTKEIYLQPEEEKRYTPTRDYFKTCACPSNLWEFEIIEYAAKALDNKEVPW